MVKNVRIAVAAGLLAAATEPAAAFHPVGGALFRAPALRRVPATCLSVRATAVAPPPTNEKTSTADIARNAAIAGRSYADAIAAAAGETIPTPPPPTAPTEASSKTTFPWTKARNISASEMFAVQKQVQGLSDTQTESWLTVKGYSLADSQAMMSMLRAAKAGTLQLAQWDQEIAEAEVLVVKADKAKAEAEKQRKEASEAEKKGVDYADKMIEIDKTIAKLVAEADVWGWVPFAPVNAQLEAAKKEWAEMNKEKLALSASAAQSAAAASASAAAAEADFKSAAAKRKAAMASKNSAEESEQAKLVVAAGELLAAAEAAFASRGKAAALQVLTSGTEAISPKVFEAVNLRADAKASPGSLPGRLHALLNPPTLAKAAAPTANPLAAFGGSSSSSSSDMAGMQMDQETMTRGAFVAAALAALGGGAFYASKNAPKK